MKQIVLLILIFCMYTSALYAQKQETRNSNFYLNPNDRVCYIGNSITAGGEYCFFIDLYAHTRYPNLKFESFNCGISGNSAQEVLDRLNSDILVHHPTIATIKLGMNDVHRDLYSSQKASPEIEKQQEDALADYAVKMSKVAEELSAQKCKLIFITPSIYDQTSKIATPNNFGVNDALAKCAEIVKGLANKYQAPVVDFYSAMNKINRIKQLKDSTYTLIGNDRVHPGMPGHLVMAYTFLTALHFDSLVSKVVLDARKTTVNETINCAVSHIKSDKKAVSFDLLSYSLPFPVFDDSKPALELVPFIQRLNQEILKVDNLSKGNYLLTIDKDTIGVFLDSDLTGGINLALYPQTPQYKQALRVMDVLWKRHQLISNKIRIMAMIELSALRGLKNFDDLQEIKKVLDADLSKMAGKDYYGWVRDRYADYLQMSPNKKQIEKEILALEKEINQMNQPISHHYQLLTKK